MYCSEAGYYRKQPELSYRYDRSGRDSLGAKIKKEKNHAGEIHTTTRKKMSAGPVEIELISTGKDSQRAKNVALRRLNFIAKEIVEGKAELTPERAGAALELARSAEVLDRVPENVLQILRMASGELSMQSSNEEEAAAKEEELKRQKEADEASLTCVLCGMRDRNMVTRCCKWCVCAWEASASQHGGNLRLLRIVCSTCMMKIEKNYRKAFAELRHSKKTKEEADAQLAKNFSCPQCQGPLRGMTDIFLNEKKLAQAHMVLGWSECIGCGMGMTPETMGAHVQTCDKVFSVRDEKTANYLKEAVALSLRHCSTLEKERLRLKHECIAEGEKNLRINIQEHNKAIKEDSRKGFLSVTTDRALRKRAADAVSSYNSEAPLKLVRRVKGSSPAASLPRVPAGNKR